MDRHHRNQLRIDRLRVRRRAIVIIAGFVGFLIALYFTNDPDDTLTLTLAIALVLYFVATLLLPDRFFGRDTLDRYMNHSPSNGPLPAPCRRRRPTEAIPATGCNAMARFRSLRRVHDNTDSTTTLTEVAHIKP